MFSNLNACYYVDPIPPEWRTFYIVIQRIQYVKCLGLPIDERMTVWLTKHIYSRKNKLISALYVINRVNNFLPVSAVKTIHYTLVDPYLTYGIILWGSTYKSYFTNVFIIPKKIIRSILKINFMEHSHALFICHRLLKLHDIYKFDVGKCMYNCVHGSHFPHNIHMSDQINITNMSFY